MSSTLRRVVSCTAKRCRWRQKDDRFRRSVASGLGTTDRENASSSTVASTARDERDIGDRSVSTSAVYRSEGGGDDSPLSEDSGSLRRSAARRSNHSLDSLNGQGITSNPTSPPIIVFNHSPMEKFDNKNNSSHFSQLDDGSKNSEWATPNGSLHGYRPAKSFRVPDTKHRNGDAISVSPRRFSRQRSLSVDSVDVKERLNSHMLVNKSSPLDEDDGDLPSPPPVMSSPSLPQRLGRRRSGKLLTTPENNQGLSRRGHSQKVSKKSFRESPDRKEKRKKLADVNALFQSIEEQNFDRCQDILNSSQIDVNSLNEDQLTPLDLALLTGQSDIAHILIRYGAQENPQFQSSVDTRAMVIVRLVAKAEAQIADIKGLLSGVSGSQAREMEKSLRHWEMCLFRYRAMKACFEAAVPPGQVTNVSLSVVSESSVRVCFDEPKETGNTLITRYKVEWSCYEDFQPILGQQIIEDVLYRSFEISDLAYGNVYFVRISAGNMKGFGIPSTADPPCIVPSSWRNVDNVKRRGEGIIQQLDDLFAEIKDSRPSDSSVIADVISPNCSPLMPRKSNVKQSIRNLFAVAPKFYRNLNRGVYLCCILYHRDRVLVTYDDYPPVVEVDENFPSGSLALELHWLMKVALKWCDAKALRQDLEKSISSGGMHFRNRVLQAILLLQTSTGVGNLGQFYHSPLRDSSGGGPVVLVCTNSVRDPKSINTNNVRWISTVKLNQIQRPASEDGGIKVIPIIEEAIQYHKACQESLTKGLYVGYLQLKSTVDSISIVTPRSHPNMFPHVKVRDISHITREEWDWLRQMPANQRSAFATIRQIAFHDIIVSAVKKLLQDLNVKDEDVATHRLYDLEVFELSDEVSVIMVLPSTDLVCTAPGSGESAVFLDNNKYTTLPLQVFELNLMASYQRNFTGRFCRLSSILDVDMHLAQQALREAFTGNELTIAKARVSQLSTFQRTLDELWKSVRWTMDVITFARDRMSSGGLQLNILFATPLQIVPKPLASVAAPRQISSDIDPLSPKMVSETSSWSFSDCGYQSDISSIDTGNAKTSCLGGSCSLPQNLQSSIMPLGVTCSCLCARNSSLDESDLVWLRQRSVSSTSDSLRIYVAYPTGLGGGSCVKLQVNAQTTSRDIINLVVQQMNKAAASTSRGHKGVIYSDEELVNFCLVCVVGVRERVLRDDFTPLRLQPPWSKGKLFVRLKSQLLAALDQRQVTSV